MFDVRRSHRMGAKEPAAHTVRPHAERDARAAARASPDVTVGGGLSVDTGIHTTTIEVYADPGSREIRRLSLVGSNSKIQLPACCIVHFHGIGRSRGGDGSAGGRIRCAAALFPALVSQPKSGRYDGVEASEPIACAVASWECSMPRPFKIAGSILAGDFLNLGEAIRICESAGADLLQLDVCDGHFVPTISFGEELVRRTCEVAKVPVEVHLMVSRPEDWVERMSGMGLFRMLFHIEASRRAMGVVQSIGRAGMKAGIAVNPETAATALEPMLPYVDNVCLMGIAPGFAGQKILEYTYTKIADVRSLIEKTGSPATITIDGGVKAANARRLLDAGADILVVSSGIYQHANPLQSLKELRAQVAGHAAAS